MMVGAHSENVWLQRGKMTAHKNKAGCGEGLPVRAIKSLTVVLLAYVVFAAPVRASSGADAGIYMLTRLAVTAIGSFTPLQPEEHPEGDIVEQVRSQRTGFHAEYQLSSGKTSVVGSSRNARTLLADIPDLFVEAVLATEDARFFEHPGLDPMGTTRAFLELLSGRTRGASGITQQLVKNQIVGSEVTLSRKAMEAILAIQIEDVLHKDSILEAYLGAVWFGRGWGAGGAAISWFGKEWADLTLSEVAFLAGILQGPALFNPERHPERAHARRDHVLARMRATDVINERDYQTAKAERLAVIPAHSGVGRQEWSDVSVEKWIETHPSLAELLEPMPGSDRLPVIETKIDDQWQSLAQRALRAQVARLGQIEALDNISDDDVATLEMRAESGERLPQILWSRVLDKLGADDRMLPAVVLGRNPSRLAVARGWGVNNTWEIAERNVPQSLSRGDIVLINRASDEVAIPLGLEGAVVIMNIHTGDILASVGGYDIRASRFDRTASLRQPGSAVKAFVYLAALERGWRARDLIDDSPALFEDGYRPQNFGQHYSGVISFYTAFEISSNVAAVKIANEIGIANVSDIAQRTGAYESPMAPYLSSALGASVTSLRNLVAGYATIGNGGIPVRPTLVRRITDRDGRLWQIDTSASQRMFNNRAIGEMQSMMRGVVLRGTASQAFRNNPVSVIGKTGTSQGHRDAIFVGMGADIAVGVWLGRDDNTPTNGFVGGTHAAPVAAHIFKEAFEASLITADGHDMMHNSRRRWPPSVIGARAQFGDTDSQFTGNLASSEAGAPFAFPGSQDTGVDTGEISGFFSRN